MNNNIKRVLLSKNIETIQDITSFEDPYNSYEIYFRNGVGEVFYIDEEFDVFDQYSTLLGKRTEEEKEIVNLITNMELGEYENKSTILSVLQ